MAPEANDSATASDSADRIVSSRSAADSAKADDSATVKPVVRAGEPGFPTNPLQDIPDDDRAANDADRRWFQELRMRRDQLDRVFDWVQQRFPKPPPCPWCGNDDYTVREPLVLYPQVGGIFSRSIFPFFPIICVTCGHTSFFSAISAGVPDVLGIARDTEEGEEK